MINTHRARHTGKLVNAECRLIVTPAMLLNVDMYMSEEAKFVDVYTTAKTPKSYGQWTSFVTTFESEKAKPWNEAVGDFCGGLMTLFDRHGRWTTVAELFQMGQEHRFHPIAPGQTDHWFRKILHRPVPPADSRFAWGR
jgi:hypothetical protein